MKDERARLFVALTLPESARAELETWAGRAVRELAGLRLLAPDALHVTLCFLGWRAADEIEPIGDTCVAAAAGWTAPELSLGEAVWLPPRRPRVLAVGIEDPGGAVAAVQASVSDALHAGGWYEPERRPFLAHVTVARIAKNARARPVELRPPPSLSLRGASVTLYRSRLHPAGARYEALRAIRG